MDVLRPKENFAIPSFACAEAPRIVSSGFGSIALFAGMLTPPKPVPRCAAFAASRAFRTPVASCSVVPTPPMCMKKTCGRSKKKWLCSAVTWSPLSRAALIVGFTCGSVRVMSPMTIVVSPAAWNAAQVVRPWNGCIFAPSMTAPRSPRGTLTFAMPFFTSGLSPVIFAISSASGSSAAALLAMTTARTSNSTTRIVFMTSLLSSSSFVSSVRDAAPDLASTEEKPKAEQRDQGEGHALPAAQDPVARAQAPGEAPERDERHRKPEQDVERDGALQTEQVCQPIVQAGPEGRVRAEVGARVTDAREDRRHQARDGRPEQPGRELRHALVRPQEERAHDHCLAHDSGGRGADQERFRCRRDERRPGAIDGRAESERSHDQQGRPATAASIGLPPHSRPSPLGSFRNAYSASPRKARDPVIAFSGGMSPTPSS